MKLRRLECLGFKSFANKTEFVFENGITCVVGPNGCGKSNVLDATKWVLGTLSSKAMRADELLDVVFNGAQGVPPMGFAQVSLVLDNSDKSLAVDAEEIMITRKVYRSGESEFSINKNPCRLKDIKELLYDTGVSADSYCTIEQGKIDSMINSSPRERRHIFDELSGITKYKARINESKLRLDKVSQDLTRLQDVTKEVSAQLHSIRIQAGRAKKYMALTEELQQKKSLLYRIELKGHADKIDELSNSIASTQQEIDSNSSLIAETKVNIGQLTETRDQMEKKINDYQVQVQKLTSEITYLNQLGSNVRSQLAELTNDKKEKLEEQSKIESLIQKLNSDNAEYNNEKTLLEEKLKEYLEKNQVITKHLDEAEKDIILLREEIERRKVDLVEAERKLAGYKNDYSAVESEIKLSHSEEERLIKRLVTIREDADKKSKLVLELKSKKETLSGIIQELMNQKDQLEKQNAELDTENKTLTEEVRVLEGEIQNKQGLKQALEELEQKKEGIDQNALRLLSENREGVYGILADHIDVEPRYARAIDMCLSDKQGCLLVGNADIAHKILANSKGRIGIVLTDESQPVSNGNDSGKSAEQFVKIKAYQNTISKILNDYLILDDTKTALDYAADKKCDKTIVTLDGLKITRNIIFRTGGDSDEGIISRRSRLKTLTTDLTDLKDKYDRSTRRLTEVTVKLKQVSDELNVTKQKVYQEHVELRDVEAKLEEAQQEEKVLKQELATNELESSQLEKNILSHSGSLQRLSKLITDIEELRNRLQMSLEEAIVRDREYAAQKEIMLQTLSANQIELAKVEEKQKTISDKSSDSQNRISQYKADLEKIYQVLQNIASKITALTDSHGKHVEDIENKTKDIESLSKSKETLVHNLDNTRNKVDEVSKELSALEKKSDELNTLLREAEIKIKEENVRLESLKARIFEEFGNSIDETGELQDADKDALQSEVKAISERVATFGAVNMLAIEKLKELEEREQSLLQTEKDLLTTKIELEEFIEKVNKQSVVQFEKTIDSVKEHFNNIFRKVFGGGKADILIEKEGLDPLEYGVEITAKLPKKEISKLSLMSGGEKALTAISLTLALFQTKPAAFCFLDEVDSPLDEANIERFTNLIKEFSKDTQFIVITHNKRTMMSGDKIYGISMQPAGVTRRVAVDLRKEDVVQVGS